MYYVWSGNGAINSDKTMYNLIQVVEDLIIQKKQNLKYQNQERNAINQRLQDEEKELYALQKDLEELKRMTSPVVATGSLR